MYIFKEITCLREDRSFGVVESVWDMGLFFFRKESMYLFFP